MQLEAKEINEIKYYRDKIQKEYQESIQLKAELDQQTEKARKSLEELDKMKGIVLGKLDIEYQEKLRELEDFKDNKKEFIEKLREREIEINNQTKKLESEFQQIQGWKEKKLEEEKKIQEVSEQLQDKIVDFDRKTKDVDIVLYEIKQSQDQTRKELAKAKDLAEKAEEQFQEQQRITKELETKRKLLDLKVEAKKKSKGALKNG